MTDPRETEQPDIVERLKQHDLNLCPEWREETDCKAWIDLADALMADAVAEIEWLRANHKATEERFAESLKGSIAEVGRLLEELEEARERNLIAHYRADNAAADLDKARAKALEEAARVGYRTCAETRHVKLGDAVATAIRALATGKEGVQR